MSQMLMNDSKITGTLEKGFDKDILLGLSVSLVRVHQCTGLRV